MPLFAARQRRVAESIAELTFCNPFRPRRIELERAALGSAYVESIPPWNQRGELVEDHPNVIRLLEIARSLVDRARRALIEGVIADDGELSLYEDLVLFGAFHAWRERFAFDPDDAARRRAPRRHRTNLAEEFREQLAVDLAIPGMTFPALSTASHDLACFYQVTRAFRSIFRCVIGVSKPTALFRAAVWESIFTHDLRRYRRSLHASMADIVTLIIGPSGSGKELAARAIGLSRYIPIDPSTGRFADADVADSFFALNLSALSPTLIESELFGHRRGAFTGAITDRTGWLEVCPNLGTIFLDEIGELDPGIQVKLLRVLQSRTFQRIGETKERRFRGKLIAATNRDPVAAMRQGLMREDFYYRLCADILEAPSLSARISDNPDELTTLLQFIAGRMLPDDAASLAEESLRYVREHLGLAYAWPGNVRELEQLVSNVLVRKAYRAPHSTARSEPSDELASLMRRSELTADELLRRYCRMAYERCGSYEETARRLDVDRRTVRTKLAERS